jgi:hypothetical protein
MIEWKIRNNFYFGYKWKFKSELELKFRSAFPSPVPLCVTTTEHLPDAIILRPSSLTPASTARCSPTTSPSTPTSTMFWPRELPSVESPHRGSQFPVSAILSCGSKSMRHSSLVLPNPLPHPPGPPLAGSGHHHRLSPRIPPPPMFPIWLWPTSLSGWASADWAGWFGPEGNSGFSLLSINLIDFH